MLTLKGLGNEIGHMAQARNDTLMLRGWGTAWRTFLDPHCAEWESTTESEKIRFVVTLDEWGYSLGDLIEAFKNHFITELNRPDIAAAADDAVKYYQELGKKMT
jgi:hypothetical protein